MNIRSLHTKAVLVNDLITEHNLNVFGLCETWLKPNELLPLNEASPPNFVSSHVARPRKKGGGVDLISNSELRVRPRSIHVFKTFEVLIVRSTALPSFYLAVIYRPPGAYSGFLDDFSEFVADLVTNADNIVIMGDFNIHMNSPSEPLTSAFQTLIDTFGFTQAVQAATHKNGNTLDLVLSRGLATSNIAVLPYTTVLSDHFLIKFEILVPCQRQESNQNFSSRNFNSTTATALSELLSPATAMFPAYSGSIDNLTNEFNTTLLKAIDSVAPLRLKTRRRWPTPWFTDETRTLKQLCRNHERRWRLTKLEVFHQAWKDSLLKYKDALILAKTRYFSQVINLNKNNPKYLFDTVAKLTLRQPTPDSSFYSADEFMKFFAQKIESIRDEIKNTIPIALPVTSAGDHAITLSDFKSVSLEMLTKLVSVAKQTTCLLDPLPAKLLKE
nr:uncharacterized protein LOC125988967 [Syngnathus scovelli]